MKYFPSWILLAAALWASAGGVGAAELASDDFTYASSLDGTGPLYALTFYQPEARNLPIMVVMHGYGGKRTDVEYSARRMAERGYFAVSFDTRGWGGAGGQHDDGGLETMDIYDGVQAVVAKYGDRVDGKRVSIVGYSNGGGMTFMACTRFPYFFRGGLPFFGIPDYGQWIALVPGFAGWLGPNGEIMGYGVWRAAGATPEQAPERYVARSATLAAGNLISGLRLHIVYDVDEPLCPPKLDEDFVAAAQAAGVKTVFTHISQRTDPQRWWHGYNSKGHLNAMEDLFMDDIEKNQPHAPVMPDSGVLTVVGYLVTPKFRIIVGKGDDAAARVNYRFVNGAARFIFTPLSRNVDAPAKVTLLDAAPRVCAFSVGNSPRQALPAGTREAAATISSSVTFWPSP